MAMNGSTSAPPIAAPLVAVEDAVLVEVDVSLLVAVPLRIDEVVVMLLRALEDVVRMMPVEVVDKTRTDEVVV